VKNCNPKEKSISQVLVVQEKVMVLFLLVLEVVFGLDLNPVSNPLSRIRIRNLLHAISGSVTNNFQIIQICKNDPCYYFYQRNVEAEKNHRLNCLGE
jgi:hypothetical protein